MSYGLSERPTLAPGELAAVTAAAQALMTELMTQDDVHNEIPPWRFSGRWFGSTRFTALRRPDR